MVLRNDLGTFPQEEGKRAKLKHQYVKESAKSGSLTSRDGDACARHSDSETKRAMLLDGLPFRLETQAGSKCRPHNSPTMYLAEPCTSTSINHHVQIYSLVGGYVYESPQGTTGAGLTVSVL